MWSTRCGGSCSKHTPWPVDPDLRGVGLSGAGLGPELTSRQTFSVDSSAHLIGHDLQEVLQVAVGQELPAHGLVGGQSHLLSPLGEEQ